jgi:hypothetical protein
VDSFFVEGCEFNDSGTASGVPISTGAHYFHVSDCRFTGSIAGIGTSAKNIVVEGCDFSGVKCGVSFGGWPPSETAHISYCNFEDVETSSIVYDYRTTSMVISHCNLEKGEGFAVEQTPHAKTGIDDTPLLGGGRYTLETSENHHSDLPEIRTEPIHFDARNNYWGTDNPDSIQAWIEDWHDDPEIPIIVDWDPFEPSIVATKKTTLDGVRALFR